MCNWEIFSRVSFVQYVSVNLKKLIIFQARYVNDWILELFSKFCANLWMLFMHCRNRHSDRNANDVIIIDKGYITFMFYDVQGPIIWVLSVLFQSYQYHFHIMTVTMCETTDHWPQRIKTMINIIYKAIVNVLLHNVSRLNMNILLCVHIDKLWSCNVNFWLEHTQFSVKWFRI